MGGQDAIPCLKWLRFIRGQFVHCIYTWAKPPNDGRAWSCFKIILWIRLNLISLVQTLWNNTTSLGAWPVASIISHSPLKSKLIHEHIIDWAIYKTTIILHRPPFLHSIQSSHASKKKGQISPNTISRSAVNPKNLSAKATQFSFSVGQWWYGPPKNACENQIILCL